MKARLESDTMDLPSKAYTNDVCKVSWLPDRPNYRRLPSLMPVAFIAVFVPGYSGGAAPDSHRLPCLKKTK